MDLQLDARVADGYRSGSQRARRMTEAWAERELYCPACPAPALRPYAPNRRVEDFRCPRCGRLTQLKAKRGRIGSVVANSAYEVKIERIRRNLAPDYAFLAYDADALAVRDLFVVPGPLITTSAVARRLPLRATARRAGWIGSNILLDRLPESGRIAVVVDSVARAPVQVRRDFKRVAFMQHVRPERRGWLADVMTCIESLGLRPGEPFTLADIYAFEDRLAALHPKNRHVRPKIRQQLQVLRDVGYVRFAGLGRYERRG